MPAKSPQPSALGVRLNDDLVAYFDRRLRDKIAAAGITGDVSEEACQAIWLNLWRLITTTYNPEAGTLEGYFNVTASFQIRTYKRHLWKETQRTSVQSSFEVEELSGGSGFEAGLVNRMALLNQADGLARCVDLLAEGIGASQAEVTTTQRYRSRERLRVILAAVD